MSYKSRNYFPFLFFLVFALPFLGAHFAKAQNKENTIEGVSAPSLRFAVPQTLLNDNWLIIPSNFTEHLMMWDDFPQSALTGSQAHAPQWDAIMLSGEECALGCAQGWLSTFYDDKCGQPAGYLHSALIWHKDRFSSPPNWPDMWDVVRHPGKRGLPRQARGTLEIALLADKVLPTEIYKTLSTSKGQKRAFRLLNRIRPFIAWYRTTEEFQEILRNKNIIIGIAPLSALASAPSIEVDPSFIPNYANSVYSKRFWAIPSSLSSSVHKHVEKVLEKAAPHLSFETPDMTDASLIIDNDFWMIYAPVLEPAFKKWLETGIVDIKANSHQE